MNEKEFTIWFCGLLSTDGYVAKANCNGGVLEFYSVEKEWINQVRDILDKFDWPHSVDWDKNHPSRKSDRGIHRIRINDPRRLWRLIKKYDVSYAMMERKWKNLNQRYIDAQKYKKWTKAEKTFIKEHIEEMTYKK